MKNRAISFFNPEKFNTSFIEKDSIASANFDGFKIYRIEEVLADSPFRSRLRRFKSAVLAKELSSRLARDVAMTIVQANAAECRARCPAVEIFIADLPPAQVEDLVAQETGCHVALAIAPDVSLDRARDLLHAHGRLEIPLMRDGAIANPEMSASVLYVDVPGHERTRRLELIASGS